MTKAINNEINTLRLEMNRWAMIPFHDEATLAECFSIVNDYEEWRIKMFYVRFGPYMAMLLDAIDRELKSHD